MKIRIITFVPINVSVMCVILFILEGTCINNRYCVSLILVVLALPVHYYAHLNCESFRHVDFASLMFVSGTHVFR